MAFSRRRQDIEQTLAREGLTGAEAAQNIAHRTRLAKDHRDEESLKAEWRSRAQQYGIEVERLLSQSHDAAPSSFDSRKRRKKPSARVSTKTASARRSLIAVRSKRKLFSMRWGRRTRSDTRESERFERNGRLIAAGNAVNSPRGAYTTPEMIALERGNIELMRAGQGRAAAIGSPNEIRRGRASAICFPIRLLSPNSRLRPPTGSPRSKAAPAPAKTTTVGAIREFAEDHGYAVYGFAPTTRAVKSLSEAGVSARTVASLLEGQPPDAQTNQIWIVDESSLLPTRQVNRLLRKAREQSVERIVFVGDQRQHHAIEAGRPVYQMQEAGMLVARLDTIRRQRDPELREAVTHAAKGEIAESLAILERRGDIREVADIEQRRTADRARIRRRARSRPTRSGRQPGKRRAARVEQSHSRRADPPRPCVRLRNRAEHSCKSRPLRRPARDGLQL